MSPHGGSFRDEFLMSFELHNRLPNKFPEGSRVFVVDPMLATGMSLLCMKTKALPNDVGSLNYAIKIYLGLLIEDCFTTVVMCTISNFSYNEYILLHGSVIVTIKILKNHPTALSPKPSCS